MSSSELQTIMSAFSIVLISALLQGAETDFRGGRIAISHDGAQDPDDILAAPLECAMIHAAGLGPKLVHFDYMDQVGKGSRDAMEQSCLEAARRFRLNRDIFFNCQTQLNAAIANFAKEGNKSTESDPLWFACAGPMEVPWRMIMAVDPDKRKFIHCVSHSRHNENNTKGDELKHTWHDLAKLGVVLHQIRDGNRNWNTDPSEWSWLKDSSNPDYRWLYDQKRFKKKGKVFDASDAICVYWIITGGTKDNELKSRRAGELSTACDCRALLE
jgi:hypothetical protein